MAIRADFHGYIFYRRPGLKTMPAGAFYRGLEIFRMYFGFQLILLIELTPRFTKPFNIIDRAFFANTI
jgi:hypothetical protein